MKFADEYARKHTYLKQYKNKGARYTPSLTNRQWIALAVAADIGWLLNLAFVAIYLATNGFHAELPVLLAENILELVSVAAVLFGYGAIAYVSRIGEKEQQTAAQKNAGFGVATFGSLFAFLFAAAKGVTVLRYGTGGAAFAFSAAFGALVLLVGCGAIYRSFAVVQADA